MTRPLLITGGAGMLGRAVAHAAAEQGFTPIALGHRELDLTDDASVGARLAELQPDAIINCAAWTDVDGAESDEQGALEVNGFGAGNLARAAADAEIRLVHLSTDYVFAGDDSAPRRENDPTGPETAYGRTKLAGEEAVVAAGGDHLIARTAWLFGAGGKNFVDTMLALSANRDVIQVVDDQVGCPTWAGHLAPALVALAAGHQQGIAHLAGSGQASWFMLARETLERAGRSTVVEPVDSSAFQRPAPRPAYSILENTRADIPGLPMWEEGLIGHLTAIGALAGAPSRPSQDHTQETI